MYKYSASRYVNLLNQSIRDIGKIDSRIVSQLCGVRSLQDVFLRHISLSAPRWEDQKKQKPRKIVAKAQPKGKIQISAEMEKAAVQAAKSLPGDWTKTAEELLARLQSKDTSDGPEAPRDEPKSLLSTMKVGRSFESSTRSEKRRNMGRDPEDDRYPTSVVSKVTGPPFTSRGRKPAVAFKDLFGMPRLGIFAKKKKSEVTQEFVQQEGKEDLWSQVHKEHVRRLQGGLPRNAFEEMIQWTNQGKVWTFPVDNEADLHEERKYKFHDHVFLERHLSEFPTTGPVRKFMELVTLGLSQNPWLTVPEKQEHIAWFGQYFREKQEVLESALGEKGKMKALSAEEESQ